MNQFWKTFLWIKGIVIGLPALVYGMVVSICFIAHVISTIPSPVITSTGHITLAIATFIVGNLLIAKVYIFIDEVEENTWLLATVLELLTLLLSAFWIKNMIYPS